LKKLFNYKYQTAYLDVAILFARVAGGAFMLTHGLPKLEKLMAGGDVQFADPMGIGMSASLLLAVITEVFFAFLLIVGLATRAALLGLAGTMAVAAFIFHSGDPFEAKEKALLYLVIYGFIFISGAGKYSLDYLLYRKMK
jgi:putative oxidoreductase